MSDAPDQERGDNRADGEADEIAGHDKAELQVAERELRTAHADQRCAEPLGGHDHGRPEHQGPRIAQNGKHCLPSPQNSRCRAGAMLRGATGEYMRICDTSESRKLQPRPQERSRRDASP